VRLGKSKHTIVPDTSVWHTTTFLVSQLVIYGLLVIHTQDSYLFAIRRAGSFMTPFIKGRVEILRTLKRRQTRDILEKASSYITGFYCLCSVSSYSDVSCPVS
jgi:hypothetical protein